MIAGTHALKSLANLVAVILAGTWRGCPPRNYISADELVKVNRLLLASGAAALGWWKIRYSKLRKSPAALELQEQYRAQTLQSALDERQIERLFNLLRRAGVEPLLIKGWALARLYPESGLRPCGDVDLYVEADQLASARAALNSSEGKQYSADLHQELQELDDRAIDDLYARSQIVRLGQTDVRILSAEDLLRLQCIHFLRHGAWRPLWLCDIAAALEARPANFDWDYCLGGNCRRADWVACSVGLAHQLLGAHVEDTPVAARAKNLPRWLIPNVLKQWETPYTGNQAPMRHRAPMATYLNHPAGVWKDIRNRWPNPIEATISVNGPLNELPRLPFQIGALISRTRKFLSKLPAQLSESKSEPPTSERVKKLISSVRATLCGRPFSNKGHRSGRPRRAAPTMKLIFSYILKERGENPTKGAATPQHTDRKLCDENTSYQ
ncbi:MAG TPA: nucleotidyltransferase family protein [Acidobacteriota bacterium]|jgi:hypothetical protein